MSLLMLFSFTTISGPEPLLYKYFTACSLGLQCALLSDSIGQTKEKNEKNKSGVLLPPVCGNLTGNSRDHTRKPLERHPVCVQGARQAFLQHTEMRTRPLNTQFHPYLSGHAHSVLCYILNPLGHAHSARRYIFTHQDTPTLRFVTSSPIRTRPFCALLHLHLSGHAHSALSFTLTALK